MIRPLAVFSCMWTTPSSVYARRKSAPTLPSTSSSSGGSSWASPFSWKKGVLSSGLEPHRWIGIDYTLTAEGAIMRLPPAFVAELLGRLLPACSPAGLIDIHELDVLIGKAARVAHVVPTAKPFVAGLWGGLSEVKSAAAEGRREAPPGMVPCRRLCYAAAWIRALLAEEEGCPLRL